MTQKLRRGAAMFLVMAVWCLGLSARAQVVARKITLDRARYTLYMSDTVKLSVTAVLPGAAAQGYAWGSSNPSVATVDERGLVTPHKPGMARIYAQTTGPGKVRGVCQVTVKRDNVRRALVLGSGAGNAKLGASTLPSIAGEVRGVAKAMAQSAYRDGYGINISSKLNMTKAQVMAAIRRKFADAGPKDVSFVYITGHGMRTGGEYYVLPCKDRMISAKELRQALDGVQGKVVLVVNACYSGTVITGKGAAPDFGAGFVNSFLAGSGAKYTTLTGEKYLVLCATAAREEGWTYMDGDAFKYLDAFGTPFAQGVGWDYVGGERSLLADLDGDFQVTLKELYTYLKGEVARRAKDLGCVQTVTVYPAGGTNDLLFDLRGAS